MNFPALSALRAALSSALRPGGLAALDRAARRAASSARREGQTALRHWGNQGGLTAGDSGDVSLRAGHALTDQAVGASLTLTADGHAVVTAPAGLVLSGDSLYTSNSPTDAVSFSGGRLRLHPQWERRVLVGAVGDDEALLAGFYVAPGPGLPATVPLTEVLRLTALYQRSQDYSA